MITVAPINEALALREAGYSVIPLLEDSKKPAIDWKGYQTKIATLGEVYSWFGALSRFNLGVVCGQISGGLFVKDFDDIELARDFYREHKGILKTLVRTGRGIHCYFRDPDRRNSQGDRVDGRGEGGYVVGAGSTVKGFEYRYVSSLVRPEELPELPNCPESPDSSVRARNAQTGTPSIRREVKDAIAYLTKVESVQGQRGSSGLVRAVSVCRDAGMSQVEATLAIVEWNKGPTVSPPWSHAELARAITRTYERK